MTRKESFSNNPETGECETLTTLRAQTPPNQPNTAHAHPPMKQIDYCRGSGLSKARVSELVRQGMPMTNPESADA